MVIEKLETKIKLAGFISLIAIVISAMVSVVVFFISTQMVNEARKTIYVLDGNVPILATQTNQEVNIEIEAKSHIQTFHQLFFSLPPDDEYINYTIEKAMYLIDESGLKQKNALQEKGFYAGIMAQSASFSIMCDSILFNKEEMSFKYFGTQRIERKTSIVKRQLITEGKLRQITRTNNNPHGLIICDYKTVINKDLEYTPKSNF